MSHYAMAGFAATTGHGVPPGIREHFVGLKGTANETIKADDCARKLGAKVAEVVSKANKPRIKRLDRSPRGNGRCLH